MKLFGLMLRNSLLCGGLALSSLIVCAQNSEMIYPVSYEHLNVVPAESWMFMKYGPERPSLYTGTARAEIPLYTYRDVDFEIPLTLNYASNGLLPNVQAGSSGLGWFLAAGGAITREVNGFPDETGGSWDQKFIAGYEYYVKEMPPVKSPLMQKITHCSNYPVISDGTRYYETTPDIFRFNFLGHSGTFLRTHDGIKVFNTSSPSGEYRVEIEKPWKITITTGNGYVYRFDREESYVIADIAGGDGPAATSTHRWTLSEIEAPNGRKVLFRYKNIGDCVNRRPAGDIGKFYGNNRIANYLYTFQNGVLRRVPTDHDSAYSPYCYTTDTHTFALSEIIVDGGTHIQFEYNDRLYKERGYQAANLGIGTAVDNLKTPQKLNAIYVYRKTATDSVLLKKGMMGYIYGVSGGNPVMMLRSVDLSGEGRYEMRYYDETKAFPLHFNLGIDHWGYYNGKRTMSLYDFIPVPTIGDQAIEVLGSDSRDPDATSARQGMLQWLIYPTGGCSEYEYEEHTFSRTTCGSHIDLSRFLLGGSLQGWRTGGLRIRKITDYNLFTEANKKVLSSREYIYDNESGVSSGILTFMPQYRTVRGFPYEDEPVGETAVSLARFMALIQLAESAHEAVYGYDQNRTHIEYRHVRERYQDGSSRIYEFSTTWDTPDEMAEDEYIPSGSGADVPYDECPSEDRLPCSLLAQRGKLVSTDSYDATGRLVRRETTVYGADALDYIEEAKSGPFCTYSHYIYTDDYPIVETRTTTYYDDGALEESVRYTYNALKQVDCTAATGSKGDTLIVRRIYAHQLPAGPLGDSVRRRNLRSYPLKTVTIRKNDRNEEQVVDATRYDYMDSCGMILLSSYAKARIEPSVGSEQLQFDSKMHYQYNSMGRIMEIRDELDQPTCYLWGHGGMYPVAKIENIDYAILWGFYRIKGLYPEALPTNIERDLRTLDDVLVTTYAYKMLVGVTRITDPSGHKTTYEYYDDGKLHYIRDDNDKILKSYDYHLITDNF